ncbi:MAG TPA: TIGR04211 family SH3 domain-containing protein [Marinobacterium sp.]|nr:TIGR04211 family SH3 domain-containing protein [Marinobacterium sp.]
MLKRLSTLSIFSGLVFSVSVQAAFIADDVQLFMHSGPSYEYRISGRVRSGEPVEILEKSGDYTKVRLESGKDGWVPTRYIAEGRSALEALPVLQQTLADRETEVKQQTEEIQLLRARVNTLEAENRSFTEQVVMRDTQIRDLQFELQNMDQSNLMRWLTHGGIIALAGVIIGLIIPNLPKRRKQRDEWF